MEASDFEYITRLLKEESAITLEKGKEYLVECRLEPLAKSIGLESIAALVSKLKTEQDATLKRRMIESLTTHETSFFRDLEPWEVLRTKILPELIAGLRSKKELTIWCGAASSGQEPYSLCMLLREHFPELLNWKVTILATDVSLSILERARAGIYSQIEINRGLPVRLLAKYFKQSGSTWQIKPEIRAMVQYAELNLLHPFTTVPQCDLVLLRNVLIYFDLATKREILGKIRSIIRPYGYLFLGTAETTLAIDDNFKRVAFEKTSCYTLKQ
ncbi:MAG: protein-glutamate O-methyltransferase CheR [Proteobacteria bacterium]|nr:protein-glutamate O-methyltransferase CheR [Pseudomonadota bacterium]